MTTKKKGLKIAMKILLAIVVLAVLAAGTMAIVYFTAPNRSANRLLEFYAPNLTGKDAVVLPASGNTMRDIAVKVTDRKADEVLKDQEMVYEVDKEVAGITLDGTVFTFERADIKEDVTLTIKATEKNPENPKKPLHSTLKIQVKIDETLKDRPAMPLEKEGWKLFYNEEYDDEKLNMSTWTPYYLRNWSDEDDSREADYYFEDGSLVLSVTDDSQPFWALQSYERSHLHRYGPLPGKKGAVVNRDIPTFDGLATKYGYFEMRLKMPDTRDGSHFAWWMIGVQDDMNETAWLSDKSTAYQGLYSNETGEFDVIEQTISSLEEMKQWRPVIHPNGTHDYKYLWVEPTEIEGNPSSEYHVYGFEWDEKGTKFYLDGKLTSETDRTPNYRMMTFLSLYNQDGMGEDRGIFPKRAHIDYFRIYKRDEVARPTSVVLNDYNTPNFIEVPASGENKVQMKAVVIDQFDKAIDAPVKWKLSLSLVDKIPSVWDSAVVDGVSIDEKTGIITVLPHAEVGKDIFVMAYYSDTVKQTYNVKLSKDEAKPNKIIFESGTKRTVKAGEAIDVKGVVFDQYMKPMNATVTYQISVDVSARNVAAISGVSVTDSGKISVAHGTVKGTQFVVTARSGDLYQNAIVTVE